ncbi:hypothetical protein [Streptomyces minutiscleroticus]|uniref:hypothetical protein n=1 Tax=Streptomyces minutiscleroticus TaxID=68238 RepID=UPI00167CE1EF|nr:hypothetical protein [Streptomyces minutiscleroticus]
MAAMHRGVVHVLAWSLATGAAVTLSWWGVRTVMTGTAYDPPRALPVTVDQAGAAPEPMASSTSRPRPSKSPSERAETPQTAGTSKTSEPSASTSERPARSPSPAKSPPAGAGSAADTASGVESYDTKGGRVVFDLGPSSATLVSATPGSGWSMQVWNTDTWIRVDFAAGSDRVSVFCTWHDSAPRVEINNY